ncbi:hypothetical protein Tco_0090259 [Tanacetum coccineum]
MWWNGGEKLGGKKGLGGKREGESPPQGKAMETALPWDSPLAFDTSNAILKLTETGDTGDYASTGIQPLVPEPKTVVEGNGLKTGHYAQLKPDVTITSADLAYYGSIADDGVTDCNSRFISTLVGFTVKRELKFQWSWSNIGVFDSLRAHLDTKIIRQLDIANREAVYNSAEWGLGLDEVEE